jgi:hypothetical protein
MAVTARGLAKAAEILAGQFTLVATNVPYLGRGKQDEALIDFCERVHPEAKADLATCFVERSLAFTSEGGSIALVTPQNWWFLTSYTSLRASLLNRHSFDLLATLGEEAWQSFGDRGPVASLLIVSEPYPHVENATFAIDALPRKSIGAKIQELVGGQVSALQQTALRCNPDSRIVFAVIDSAKLLTRTARPYVGFQNGDTPRYIRSLWEIPKLAESEWRPMQTPPNKTDHVVGLDSFLSADFERGRVAEGSWHNQSSETFGNLGVLVRNMRDLSATRFWGGYFDQSGTAICCSIEVLPALWCFTESLDFQTIVRQVERKVNITPASFGKITFDVAHWQQIAAERYPNGLPKPHSDDPTQWLFAGHPKGSEQPLQVAVARLLGYRWPRQTGSEFPDCPALGPDGLEDLADADGICCLPPINKEQPAAARLRNLLAAAFGADWSPSRERDLLAATWAKRTNLEDWLRDAFFEQHCKLFKNRPFIWHIWDGRKDGFHALANYHRLDHANLQKLTYSYLGDWIRQQEGDARADKPGAAERLGVAQALEAELIRILEGEPPYDLFIRWKPLKEQPLGWQPDLNDGVRLNIRPFLQARDLGKKGAGILRAKPNIKWDKDRGTEPHRDKADYPWFWHAEEPPLACTGGPEFTGNRWNLVHLTLARKRAARQGHGGS